MFDLYSYLKDTYKVGEPILLKDLKFNGVKETTVRGQLKKLTDNEFIGRFESGVYYLLVRPSDRLVAKYRFIERGGNSFGYYSKNYFAHQLGISSKKSVPEIVTNEFKPLVRKISVGNETYIVRHSQISITNENKYVLQLLDLLKDIFKYADCDISLIKEKLEEYINKHDIKKEDADRYINLFPNKIFKNIYTLRLEQILN